MSKNRNQKLVTPEIFHQAVIGSFTKLNPRYMMKNPVMFVVEVGCIITLLLSIFPGQFEDNPTGHQGTSFAGKWHGEGSPLQPAEER